MATSITPERWRTLCESLSQAGDRFANLVSSVGDPEAKAVGNWSAAETAAHVAVIASLFTTMLSAGASVHPIPRLEDRIRESALDEVGALNEYALVHMAERDPVALGGHIREAVGKLIAMSHNLDPSYRVTWLGSAQVPVAGWYAHLLNELHLHGLDIARAGGERWDVPQLDAAMSFEVFLVAMLRGDTGHLLAHEPMSRSEVAIRFRSRYTTPVVLAVQDGRIVIDPPNSRLDATLYFQPAALMQILFKRLSKTRAALTGQIAVWGRKPWQLSQLLQAVRFP